MGIKKYDIVKANLNPAKGHTQSGTRPCVVISSNAFNQASPTILIVPLTSNNTKIFPSEFWIEPSKANGLAKKSRFLGTQILNLDKRWVVGDFGHLETKHYSEVREALSISVDWYDLF